MWGGEAIYSLMQEGVFWKTGISIVKIWESEKKIFVAPIIYNLTFSKRLSGMKKNNFFPDKLDAK